MACLRGGRLLFERLSFVLEPGAAGLVIGPNGAGKSSLLRIAAGLLRNIAGTVERQGMLALSAEQAALDAEATLGGALAFWARLDRAGTEDVERALDAMALRQLAPVPIRLLSTGQRKRATLARVIASRAPLWLLDEPANGLDDASRERLGAAMAAHRRNGGVVLAASHQPLDLADAQRIALG